MLEVGIPAIKLSPRASLQHRRLASWEGGRKEPTSITVYWSENNDCKIRFLQLGQTNKLIKQTSKQSLQHLASWESKNLEREEGTNWSNKQTLQHLHLTSWEGK